MGGATQSGPKVVIEVTIHDLIAKFSLGGIGRRHLWQKDLEIYCQRGIYDQKMEGIVRFEFKFTYKLGMLGY